ncbi:hypothetical protein STEG23_029568, partial [Scotinomys teguina]
LLDFGLAPCLGSLDQPPFIIGCNGMLLAAAASPALIEKAYSISDIYGVT